MRKILMAVVLGCLLIGGGGGVGSVTAAESVVAGVAGDTGGAVYSAGFRAVESAQFSGGVWYPSVDEEREKKWGPFRPSWAWDGAPAAGRFPVVLLSHGAMGRYRNHRDTAVLLARAGYVVIAPQHAKDEWVSTNRTVAAVEYRIAELSRVPLNFAAAAPELAAMMDTDIIGAVGYSLGGLTALGASGALPNTEYAEAHCRENSARDGMFCLDALPWWQHALLWLLGTKFYQWFDDSDLAVKDTVEPLAPPLEFCALALVAPVAATYTPEEVRRIKPPLAVFRLGEDAIVRFPFHADHLHRALTAGARAHVYKVFEDAHHFAFINSFPDWLLREEHIPVGIDPAGFDRAAFLREINGDILRFFQTQCPRREGGAAILR